MSPERVSPLDIKRESQAAKHEHLEMRKRIVFDTLRSGLRMYLYGAYGQMPKLKNEGGDALRVGGQLLANTLSVGPEDAAHYVTELYEADVALQVTMPHMHSLIAARLAEGLYEAGNKEAALHLAATFVDDVHRPEVEEYFHLRDGNFIRPHHA